MLIPMHQDQRPVSHPQVKPWVAPRPPLTRLQSETHQLHHSYYIFFNQFKKVQPKSTGKGQNTRTSIDKVLENRNFTKLQQAEDKNTSKCEGELKTSGSGILIDKYLFETLGLQRKCRVHKDYMITPYIMDNWFIF